MGIGTGIGIGNGMLESSGIGVRLGSARGSGARIYICGFR